jgi:putative flippase GtrA
MGQGTTMWRTEFGYLVRFVIAGGLNAMVGLGSIFLLMYLGVSPVVANVMGYAISLAVAFFTARVFVFRSVGRKGHDGIKYLASFLISFGANLLMLHICLEQLLLNKNISQLLATCAYVGTMFLLSRIFVFNKRS